MSRVCFFCALAAALLVAAPAGGTLPQPVLLKDVNPGAGSSGPQSFVSMGGVAYFVADDGVHGYELWRTDGTSSGTGLVKDINPGSAAGVAAYSAELQVFGNMLFFLGIDSRGQELWKSDGTPNGTVIVKDANPNGDGAFGSPDVVGGALYYTGSDGVHGWEPWRSDGTEAGTSMLKDMNPAGPGAYSDSSPAGFAWVNGTVVFHAFSQSVGDELWRTDGTEAGTTLVKDLDPYGGSYPTPLFTTGTTLLFVANDGSTANGLWKTDGTPGGTVRFGTFTRTSSTVVNGAFLFFGSDGTTFGLWKSDGTEAGTVLVKAMSGGDLVGAGQRAFFFRSSGPSGWPLWVTDGTSDGTKLARLIPAPEYWSPSQLAGINGTLLFQLNDGVHGWEPWESDGTEAGTRLLDDLAPGGGDSEPSGFTLAGSNIFFNATNGTQGRELWKIPVAPTALRSTAFSATRAGRSVVMRWRTGSEAAVAGFNVWRGKGVARTKVNRRLLAAKHRGQARGASYRFVDRRGGRASRYWLETVGLDGSHVWSGPVAVR